ncbi:putative disease resistance protein At1g59780 [Silene latifolia]|uniref:putative disease resistance protein At1g59780 n=1 Tax=Silene latifolia TaxID=37657 RepID=UPI003D78442F
MNQPWRLNLLALLHNLHHSIKSFTDLNLVQGLQDDLARTQQYFQDADAQKGKSECLNQLRELGNDAEDTIDTYIFNVHGKGHSNLFRTRKFAKQIQRIRKSIKEVTTELMSYGLGKVGQREGSRTRNVGRKKQRNYSYDDDNEHEYVVGLEEDIQKLVGILMGDEGKSQVTNAISIVGMGGCGKTTLAKKLYNHPYTEECFDYMAWIFISQEWDTKHILSEILRNVVDGWSSKDKALSVEGLVDELRNFLKDRSYLIVLDDVWHREVLDEILPAIPYSGSNVRRNIIITTRNRDIIQLDQYQQHMHIHEPQPLSEEEGWELLNKIALSNVPNYDKESYESLGKEMLQKCDGLPLAIRALAGILSGKQNNIGQWQMVNQAVRLRVMEGTSADSRVKELLALSYDDLRYDLKPCFLYLSAFPEDCEIPAGMLIRMWIAEGLAPANGDLCPEDVAMQYLEELNQRFLIQVASFNYKGLIKAVRLHDLLRELCIKEAKDQHFFDTYAAAFDQDTCGYSPSVKSQPRRLALHSCTLLPEQAMHLRSLVLQTESSVRHSAYLGKQKLELGIVTQTFILLRLLTLWGIKTDSGTLPAKMGCLIHLRYLAIRASNITELPPSIGSLRNLLTLDYRNVDCDPSVPIKIPNVLWKLVLLRHLFLPVDHLWDVEDLELTPLKSLQTLWGIKQQRPCNTNWLPREAVDLSIHLKKLQIVVPRTEDVEAALNCPSLLSDRLHTFHCELTDGAILRDVRPLSSLQQLHKLVLVGQIQMELSNLLPEKIVKLVLKDSMLKQNVDLGKVLGTLARLKLLKLSNAYLGTTLACFPGSFPQLEELYLESLCNLDSWIIEEGAMPCLGRLEIVSCWHLRQFPRGLHFLTALKQFEFFEMPKLFRGEAIECGWSQKRLGLPHHCREIIKHSDSPIPLSSVQHICEQLALGIFLNDRKQKYWIKKHDGSYKNCFMVYATDLTTRWYSNGHRYDYSCRKAAACYGDRPWIWSDEIESYSGGTLIKVAKLAPDLDIVELIGTFNYDSLSPEVTYEVVYEIMLGQPETGYEMLTESRLTLPDGSIKSRGGEQLNDKPLHEWIPIVVAEFETSLHNSGHLEFSLTCERRGLIVKGVIIRPKE